MKKRHEIIIQAFRDLGGTATLEEISKKTGLHVNGLSQSMSYIGNEKLRLLLLGGKGKEQKYTLEEDK